MIPSAYLHASIVNNYVQEKLDKFTVNTRVVYGQMMSIGIRKVVLITCPYTTEGLHLE